VYEATTYYRKLYAGIQKIQELKETKEMPQGELEEYDLFQRIPTEAYRYAPS